VDTWTRESSSFRDPAGFVFTREGVIYRQVNEAFGDTFDAFVRSGLYADLANAGLLVEHDEVPLRIEGAPPARAVLRPARIPFVSYPYEWCPGQLRDAALLTLELQKRALARGFVLRDASAFNVQFVGCRPVWIDTLSFGRLVEGEPWLAYRQFCQHFLAPLALMCCADPALGRLSALHIDGVPLERASALLPARTRLRLGLLTHLHLHARSIVRAAAAPAPPGAPEAGRARAARRPMGASALLAFADSLESTVRRLTWHPTGRWTDYSADTSYSTAAAEHKRRTVARLLDEARGTGPVSMVWDLGGNAGHYSRPVAAGGARAVVMDADYGAVERLYRQCRAEGQELLLPLVQDLTNPSAAIGWHNRERRSLLERGPADVALALALVHHFAIGNGVPLEDIARMLRAAGRIAIVEFVGREDPQVQRMLGMRGETFAGYGQPAFEAAFGRCFTVMSRQAIDDSARTLYLLRANESGAAGQQGQGR
jgi:hypothetical protein